MIVLREAQRDLFCCFAWKIILENVMFIVKEGSLYHKKVHVVAATCLKRFFVLFRRTIRKSCVESRSILVSTKLNVRNRQKGECSGRSG